MSDLLGGRLLDRAAVGREIGTLVALVLIRCAGDGEAALAMLADFEGIAPPESEEELDAVPVAQQAIRDALGMGVESR